MHVCSRMTYQVLESIPRGVNRGYTLRRTSSGLGEAGPGGSELGSLHPPRAPQEDTALRSKACSAETWGWTGWWAPRGEGTGESAHLPLRPGQPSCHMAEVDGRPSFKDPGDGAPHLFVLQLKNPRILRINPSRPEAPSSASGLLLPGIWRWGFPTCRVDLTASLIYFPFVTTFIHSTGPGGPRCY